MAALTEKASTNASGDAEKDAAIIPGVSNEAVRRGSVVPEQILKHSHDADAAMKAFADYQGGPILELDEATNKRLLRKIDWHLMPILCVCYGLNYLDKTTLSYASIMGIQAPASKGGIGLHGDNYNWLGSMFYFGYIAWEYPTNRLLQYLPLGKYSAFNIVMWGLVLACFAAVKNFAGAIAIRFFLGLFEAAVTPGFALLTSQWYTKKEQGTRTGIWFSFNGFAQIFGGLVAYGIAKGTDKYGSAIAPWKIIFLVTGLLTISMGIIFYFVVPDNQMNARWLSKEDRLLAIERIRVNQQGVGNKHWKLYQLKEALLDPLTWAFFFYALVADIPNGAITNFFSLLIRSFGYTAQQSLLYGTPGGAVEVVALITCGYLGDKYGNRILIGCSGLVLAIIGMILVVALPASMNGGRLAGYYLTQASPTPFVALLSLISTNVAGYTKKTTVAALYLIGYCVGNIIGPQTFRPGNYTPAEITIIVCWCACLVDLVFIWWYCRHQNKKKAVTRAQPEYTKLENQELRDFEIQPAGGLVKVSAPRVRHESALELRDPSRTSSVMILARRAHRTAAMGNTQSQDADGETQGGTQEADNGSSSQAAVYSAPQGNKGKRKQLKRKGRRERGSLQTQSSPKQDESAMEDSQVFKTPDATRDDKPNPDDVAASSQLLSESKHHLSDGIEDATLHRDNTPFVEQSSVKKRVTPRTYADKKAKRRRIEVQDSQASPVANNAGSEQPVYKSQISPRPRRKRRTDAEAELAQVKLLSSGFRTITTANDGVASSTPTRNDGKHQRVETNHTTAEPGQKRKGKRGKKHSIQSQLSDGVEHVPATSEDNRAVIDASAVEPGVPADGEAVPVAQKRSKKRRRTTNEEIHAVESQDTNSNPAVEGRKRRKAAEPAEVDESQQPSEYPPKTEDHVVRDTDIANIASIPNPKRRKNAKEVERIATSGSQLSHRYQPDEQDQVDASPNNSRNVMPDDAPNGLLPTSGPFQAREIELLTSAVERYQQDNGLTKHELNEIIQTTNRRAEGAGLWDELTQALPNRTRTSVIKVARRRFHNYEKRGKWAPEEDEALREAYELKPNKWKEIGARIGRMPEDCRDRWRNYLKCGENRRKDMWTEQEEMELVRVVDECVAALRDAQGEEQSRKGVMNGDTATDPETMLNWNIVSEKLGGQRSRLQCTYKWKQLQQRKAAKEQAAAQSQEKGDAEIENSTSWRIRSGKENYRKMLPGDKYAIVCAVADSGTYDEKRIPWKLISQKSPDSIWSTADRKVALRKMKKLVPEQSSLQNLLATLKTYFEKHHENQLQDFYDGRSVSVRKQHRGRSSRRSSKFVDTRDDGSETEVKVESPVAPSSKMKTLSPAAKAYAAKKAKAGTRSSLSYAANAVSDVNEQGGATAGMSSDEDSVLGRGNHPQDESGDE